MKGEITGGQRGRLEEGSEVEVSTKKKTEKTVRAWLAALM